MMGTHHLANHVISLVKLALILQISVHYAKSDFIKTLIIHQIVFLALFHV